MLVIVHLAVRLWSVDGRPEEAAGSPVHDGDERRRRAKPEPDDTGTTRPPIEAGSLAPAVTRAAAILDLLAESGGEPVGPSELARRLGLPKSSIANICGALADAGLVRRISTGFALGRRLAELGGAYLATVDQVQEFYEACRQLCRPAPRRPSSSRSSTASRSPTSPGTTVASRSALTSGIGRRLPAFSTATGKAALASLPG